MYKVEFYDKNGKLIEFCEFALCAGESFADKLEEVLYIMCELPPYSREWKRELHYAGCTTFTYHCVEFASVSYKWDGSSIQVKDI